MAEDCRLREDSGRLWQALREHATHWVVGGAPIAATGLAPKEWFARTVEHLHISENALHLWHAGIDVRVLPIGVDVTFIVGDVMRRKYRKHPETALATTARPMRCRCQNAPQSPCCRLPT